MNRVEEYEVCLMRGHNPDPNRGATMNAVSWAVPHDVCVHCGTEYWTTTEVMQYEKNPPKPTPSDKEKI